MLRPENKVRQARWSNVLEWYGYELASDESLSDRNGVRAARGEQSNDWVIEVEDATTAGMAEVMGRRSGRSWESIHDVRSFRSWAAGRRPRSVLVLASRWALHFDAIIELIGAAQELRCWLGVLTAADRAGISFAIAKSIAAPRPDGPIVTADAMAHAFSVDGVSAAWSEAGLRETLTGDADATLLAGHGEGAHLLLDPIVICGRHGPRETNKSGRVVPGCGVVRQCKRVRDGGLIPLLATSVRSKLLFILSCNGFSVAEQMYPSDVSLVLAACDSYVTGVVCSPAAAACNPDEPELIAALLKSGSSLGEIVLFLNETRQRANLDGAYVIAGDPLACCAGTGTSAQAKVGGLATGPGQLLCARLPTVGVGGVLELRVGSEPVDRALIGRDVVVIAGAPAKGELTVEDRSDELRSLTSEYQLMSRRLNDAVLYEHFLIDLGMAAYKDQSDYAGGLAALRGIRIRLEHLVTTCLHSCARAEAAGRWTQNVTAGRCGLRAAIAEWDELCTRIVRGYLLSGQIVGDRVVNMLHHGLRSHRKTTGARCGRCGTVTRVRSCADVRSGDACRTAADCPLCGPLSSWMTDGPELRLETDPIRAGDPLRIVTDLNGKLSGMDREGFLLVEVRDKSKPLAIGNQVFAVARFGDSIEQQFELPIDSGFDQFSVRAIWIAGLCVTYARSALCMAGTG